MFIPRERFGSSTTLVNQPSSSFDRGREKADIEMGQAGLPLAITAPGGVESDVENFTPVKGAAVDDDYGSQQQQQQLLPQPALAGSAGGHNMYNPRSFKFWTIMFCNFLALFLVALDRTILATAIPRITDEFKSLGDVGWYASAYMLTTAASQLLFGRVYKFYPTKWYAVFPFCSSSRQSPLTLCISGSSSSVLSCSRQAPQSAARPPTR